MVKELMYLICLYADKQAASIDKPLDIGVEYMGECYGILMNESGKIMGYHYSSSFGWLRVDLLRKIKNKEKYKVVDLIGHKLPENVIKMVSKIKKFETAFEYSYYYSNFIRSD